VLRVDAPHSTNLGGIGSGKRNRQARNGLILGGYYYKDRHIWYEC